MPNGRSTPLASRSLAVNGEALFAAEFQLTLADIDDWPLLRFMLATACDRLAVRGELVRFVRGTYLPNDGRLLCLFEGPSAESIRVVLAAANLQAVRIGTAVDLPDVSEDLDADR